MIEVGTRIRIVYMDGEPQYTGREGTITKIDDMGADTWYLGWLCFNRRSR